MNFKKIDAPNLDKQFDELPKEIIFCKNCVVSNQRPRTAFNKDGLCSACVWAHEKDQVIDWKERERQLVELCDRHRSRDGSWDVIVPGSGGKDSAYVAHQLKHRFGMHPLCVTWAPFEYTPIGWKNLQAFIQSGFDNILCTPNGILHRKLARIALDTKGDAWEPFTYGQKAWAFHIASRFNVQLIMYGENGELEYGGSDKYKHKPCENPDDWERDYFKGTSVDNLVQVGLDSGIFSKEEVHGKTMQLYKAPDPNKIRELGAEMHWYSYYTKWTPQENFYYAVANTGFECNPDGRSESTYTKYASLDDKSDGFHWYLSYMKFGMGRASRDAQQDIRRHHITREEGVALVQRYDGEFPDKYFQWFLGYLGISEEHFWSVMNRYREKSNAWEKIGGEWRLKKSAVVR